MTDLDEYPSGTIIAIVNVPDDGAEREWFVRLPEHLVPLPFRNDGPAWRSLADGQLWPLDPHLQHDVIAYPNVPYPAPTPEGAQLWG